MADEFDDAPRRRDGSAAFEEEFLKRVQDFEDAPKVEPFALLQRAGLELPSPDAIDDGRLATVLRDTIDAMADHGLFLYSTNHLSDRELYARLWHTSLRDPMEWDGDDRAMWFIDLIGTGSEEDVLLNLKYYADENERRDWAEEWPDFTMPDHEDPPYDRDRFLPRP